MISLGTTELVSICLMIAPEFAVVRRSNTDD
jgi:hypothetical protein